MRNCCTQLAFVLNPPASRAHLKNPVLIILSLMRGHLWIIIFHKHLYRQSMIQGAYNIRYLEYLGLKKPLFKLIKLYYTRAKARERWVLKESSLTEWKQRINYQSRNTLTGSKFSMQLLLLPYWDAPFIHSRHACQPGNFHEHYSYFRKRCFLTPKWFTIAVALDKVDRWFPIWYP